MALRKPVHLDLASARQLLVARKDLGGRVLEWEAIALSKGARTGGERMRFEVDVLGTRLVVLARTNGRGGHQYILRPAVGPGNLARLCDDSAHAHQLHWHWFEDMPDLTEERSELSPQQTGGPTADATTLFIEFFAAELNFVPGSYTIQETLI